MGKLSVFWFRRRSNRARPGLWTWYQWEKDRDRRQMGYIGFHPKGKTEIPGKTANVLTGGTPTVLHSTSSQYPNGFVAAGGYSCISQGGTLDPSPEQ